MEKINLVMKLSNGMDINLKLYPSIAPITVNNFLKLVDSNFYNGTIFHRVIENFMIQGGGYVINGNNLDEKKSESIKGEFKSNGVNNTLLHKAGVISMARTMVKDSASSQFFICSVDTPHLDNEYAAFGEVCDFESMENVIKISKVETMNIGYGMSDFPVEPISIIEIKRI